MRPFLVNGHTTTDASFSSCLRCDIWGFYFAKIMKPALEFHMVSVADFWIVHHFFGIFVSKYILRLAVLVFALNGAVSANCDDSTSTQRSTVNSQQSTVNSQQSTVKPRFDFDEKNGTIIINGEARNIKSLIKNIDKNKKMSRREFELLKKNFGLDSQNSTSTARVGCGDGYMNLGIYGEWTWGAYMQDPYFWDYLFGSIIPQFDSFAPGVTAAQCEQKLQQCLAEASRLNNASQTACGFAVMVAYGEYGVIAGAATAVACGAATYMADLKTVDKCREQHARCLVMAL